jgi:hypothetical protein
MPFSEQLKEFPRTVVRTWLNAARLPLRAVQAVAHRGEYDSEWPPVLAFESFESQLKQLTGAVLHDEELLQEGRLIQAKVGQLRKAAELETIAERREATAAAKFDATRQAAEQRDRRIEQAATRRERELERQADLEASRIEQEAQRNRERATRAELDEHKAVAREERAAATVRVTKERESLKTERAAASAKNRVVETDTKIRATKASRKHDD